MRAVRSTPVLVDRRTGKNRNHAVPVAPGVEKALDWQQADVFWTSRCRPRLRRSLCSGRPGIVRVVC